VEASGNLFGYFVTLARHGIFKELRMERINTV
jgi:hypothetical protein